MMLYLIKIVSLALAMSYLVGAGIVAVNEQLGWPPLTDALDVHDSILMFFVASLVYSVSRSLIILVAEHAADCE